MLIPKSTNSKLKVWNHLKMSQVVWRETQILSSLGQMWAKHHLFWARTNARHFSSGFGAKLACFCAGIFVCTGQVAHKSRFGQKLFFCLPLTRALPPPNCCAVQLCDFVSKLGAALKLHSKSCVAAASAGIITIQQQSARESKCTV